MGRIVRGIWGFWEVRLGNDGGIFFSFFFFFFYGRSWRGGGFSPGLCMRRYRGQAWFFCFFFPPRWDVVKAFSGSWDRTGCFRFAEG